MALLRTVVFPSTLAAVVGLASAAESSGGEPSDSPAAVTTLSAADVGSLPSDEALRSILAGGTRSPAVGGTGALHLRGFDYRPGTFAIGGRGASGGFTPQFRVGASLQFRYTASFRDDDELPAADGEGFSHGFQRPRTRLIFDADITENLGAYISYNLSSLSSGAPSGETDGDLEEAYAVASFGDNFYIRFGQFKVGHLYEELIPDEYQAFAERSIATEYMGQQFSEGIQFGYATDEFSFTAAAHDGFGTWETSFDSGDEADIAWSFRGDWSPVGSLTQFQDFTSFRGSDYGVRIGAGLTYARLGETGAGSSGVPVQDEQDRFDWTADVQAKGDGWNAFAAYSGMTIDTEDPFLDDITSHAFSVQGGYFLTEQVEFIARYEALFPDEDAVATDDNDFSFLTLGANYYVLPQSHAAKFTCDIIYAFDETMPLSMLSNNNGVRPVGDGALNGVLGQTDDGEITLRAQFQILF